MNISYQPSPELNHALHGLDLANHHLLGAIAHFNAINRHGAVVAQRALDAVAQSMLTPAEWRKLADLFVDNILHSPSSVHLIHIDGRAVHIGEPSV